MVSRLQKYYPKVPYYLIWLHMIIMSSFSPKPSFPVMKDVDTLVEGLDYRGLYSSCNDVFSHVIFCTSD